MPERDWRVLSPVGGNHRHLGSLQGGRRTACGKLLVINQYLIELPGSIDVTCLVCKRTSDYRLAVAQKVIEGD